MKYFWLTLVALVSLNGIKDLIKGGAFRQIHPHFSGTCEKIQGVQGPEDSEYSSDLHSLFISSDARKTDADATEDGGIYKWDLSLSARPIKLQFKKPLGFKFHPHGLSLFENHQGLVRIFVVNHRSSQDTSIEVFDYQNDGNALSYVTSHQDPLLMNANDLVALDDTRFYATHDHDVLSSGLKFLEDLMVSSHGYVTYAKGQGEYLVKASHIAYANGIVMDASGTRIFVASTLHEEIQVFKRDAATGDLEFDKKIPLNASPDNLYRDPDGALWVAAHPSVLALTLHSKHHERLSPSEVIKIGAPLAEKDEKIQEVFLDEGSQISAASSAFHSNDRLILGSIFGDHLLDCRFNESRTSANPPKSL